MKKKIRGFSLIETCLALLVISQSVLVIFALTKFLRTQFIFQSSNTDTDWQIFCEQMRAELQEDKLIKVEDNFLYVSGDKTIRYGFMGSDFRKTDGQGKGYQPMLYHLQSAKISENDKLVKITVNFQKGGTREFLYLFLEKNG
ncbi:competence type IV pilus minor pilin ComGF [Lactococcus fujiensis]|uniref:competence type IV pilus minor pilin ComGF n=1 Tax=Lactococcus fujiensis TaxID=610251 RepID=UPI0006CFD588|nr:competence type IV pilus minor pilin ComGF [Lactococcus fujiensis]